MASEAWLAAYWIIDSDQFENAAEQPHDLFKALSSSAYMPSTRTPPERFFSLAGRILDNRTAHTKEETLEDRLWAKVNRGRRVKMEEQ